MAFNPQTYAFEEILTSAKLNEMDTNIDEVRKAHKGSSQPASLVAGLRWVDDSAGTWIDKLYDGSGFIRMAQIDPTRGQWRPGVSWPFSVKVSSFTVTQSDNGLLFICVGGIGVSFDPSSNLGRGFGVTILNAGSGADVDLYPATGEDVMGSNQYTIAQNESITITGHSATRLFSVPERTRGLKNLKTYTTAGGTTWTKPGGLKFVRVTLTGGGGGGSQGPGTGGGAGATVIKVIPANSLAATEVVTVGGGGVGGTAATNVGTIGKPSSFGSGGTIWAKANGGFPGVNTQGWGQVGSGGGAATSGDLNIMGGATSTDNGGASFWGGGGGRGTTAQPFGSGGGNGGNNGSGQVGGNGRTGVVMIEEFF